MARRVNPGTLAQEIIHLYIRLTEAALANLGGFFQQGARSRSQMKNGQTAGAAESRYVSYYPRPQAPSTVTSILLEAPGGGHLCHYLRIHLYSTHLVLAVIDIY